MRHKLVAKEDEKIHPDGFIEIRGVDNPYAEVGDTVVDVITKDQLIVFKK